MNPELLEALRQAGLLEAGLTDDDIARLLALGDDVTDEELPVLEQALQAAVVAIADGATNISLPDGADRLEILETVAQSIEQIWACAGRRMTAAEERQARIASIVASVAGPARPNLSRVAGRRPPGRAPIVASAPRIVTPHGVVVDGPAGIAERFMAVANQARWSENFNSVVASVEADYPEARRLDGHNAVHNLELVAAVTSLEAITAAGGFCAPVQPMYDVFQLASDERPVRDALPSFQAARGGVSFMPPPQYEDYRGAVSTWSEADDLDAVGNANRRKPRLRIECDDVQTIKVQAVPYRLLVGNMFERAYSERVQTILRDVVSQQARLAEQELIADISAASVKLTAGQTLGAARDLLAIIERAAVAYRARERMSETAVLRVLMPSYAHGIMRSDLARQLPGDNSLGVTDQQLDEYLAVRHVSPIFWLDDPDMLGAEAGGSLQGWPTSMQMWMYAEGSFLFLDGGTLDLGIVRDSTLNASNDLEIFGETFEAAAFVGRQSLEIDVDICPSGEVSGTVDVTGVICMTGS